MAKKLPLQRCSKPLFIAFFNFAHKRPTFAFTGESGNTLGPAQRIAHKGTHAEAGAFSPLATVRLCAASEISFIPPRFYIHTFPGSLRTLTISNSSISDHLSSRFSTSRTNGLRLLSQVKAGTHSAFGEGSHTRAHTAKQGGVSDGGWYHYPRYELHVHEHPRAGYQNGVLCRFGVLAGGTPEEHREPSEQRRAYARRCPEASRPRWAA